MIIGELAWLEKGWKFEINSTVIETPPALYNNLATSLAVMQPLFLILHCLL